MTETTEARLKRLSMRSWRRGTKEMDLVMGPYADAHLAGMDAETLDAFEALQAENDQDLITWVLGQAPAPAPHAALVAAMAAFARARLTPGA
jgi:antitoxin CptB